MAGSGKPPPSKPSGSPEGDDDVYDVLGDEAPSLDEDLDASGAGSLEDLFASEHAGDLHAAAAEVESSKPTKPTAAPLPRLWKADAEPQAESPSGRAPSKSRERPGPADAEPQAESPSGRAPSRSREKPAEKPAKPPETPKRGDSGGRIERSGKGTPLSEKQKPPEKPDRVREKAPEKPRKDESTARIERTGKVSSQSDKAAQRYERSASKPKAARSHDEDKKDKVLVEETPELDTYESRQKVRIVAGVVLAGILLVIAFMVIGPLFSGSAPEDPPASDTSVAIVQPVVAPPPSPEQIERDARALFNQAREAARRKNVESAITLLTQVTRDFPTSKAAREAKEALARANQIPRLPLFSDRPVVVAEAVKSKTKDGESAGGQRAVVDAVPQATPSATSGEVGIVFPPNPAEPRKGENPVVETKDAPSVGRPLPPGFRSRPGTEVDASGWALEILGDRDGAPMVLVPGGEFVMGRDDGDTAEKPAHRIFVSTFYIDQHEVTNHQYALFEREAGRRGERMQAIERLSSQVDLGDDRPVVMVNANDATRYATWAKKRLPTEAQWEKAARGPDGRYYPWGMSSPKWGAKRVFRKVDPVMSFAEDVSPYGAYDMAGNVLEWSKNWFDRQYYQILKAQKLKPSDPAGPTREPPGSPLVVKGGSKEWMITKREGLKWDMRLPYLGFRCVLQVEGPDNAFETAEKKNAAPSNAGPNANVPGANVPF